MCILSLQKHMHTIDMHEQRSNVWTHFTNDEWMPVIVSAEIHALGSLHLPTQPETEITTLSAGMPGMRCACMHEQDACTVLRCLGAATDEVRVIFFGTAGTVFRPLREVLFKLGVVSVAADKVVRACMCILWFCG